MRGERAGPDRPVTAFVLSGGSNQGVAQVGMLRALLERGIAPDVVVGTSAGALNGAALATSPTLAKVDGLEAVWLGLRGEQIFPGGNLKRAWNILRRDDHLSASDGLLEVLERARPAEHFADLAVPLRVVTTDLDSGDEILDRRRPGRRRPAGRARRIPGIFPPVMLYGHRLVDGAVVNLVPISHALAGPTDRGSTSSTCPTRSGTDRSALRSTSRSARSRSRATSASSWSCVGADRHRAGRAARHRSTTASSSTSRAAGAHQGGLPARLSETLDDSPGSARVEPAACRHAPPVVAPTVFARRSGVPSSQRRVLVLVAEHVDRGGAEAELGPLLGAEPEVHGAEHPQDVAVREQQ